MAKILFVETNFMTEPLGIASIAGTLNSHGHICDLIFLDEERDLLGCIRRTKPDLIGFSLIEGDININRKLKIMQVIKENFDTPIIVGGSYATLYPEHLLSKIFYRYLLHWRWRVKSSGTFK